MLNPACVDELPKACGTCRKPHRYQLATPPGNIARDSTLGDIV